MNPRPQSIRLNMRAEYGSDEEVTSAEQMEDDEEVVSNYEDDMEAMDDEEVASADEDDEEVAFADEDDMEAMDDEEVASADEDDMEAMDDEEVASTDEDDMEAMDDEEVASTDEDDMEAMDDEDGPVSSKRPSFKMIAYTGNAMKVGGWEHPVVVDLKGMSWSNKPRPILKDHDPDKIVGHTTAIKITRNGLMVEGVVSAESYCAKEIISSSKNGFPWQASIGADASNVEFFSEGETVKANGMEFDGPVYVSRKTVLGEVSFVALGADDATETRVAARAAKSGARIMDKKSPARRAPQRSAVSAIRAEAANEVARIAKVRAIADSHPEIAAKAIAGGWSVSKTELAVLRAERAQDVPAGIVRRDGGLSAASDSVIEAAAAKTSRLPNLEQHYSEQTLEAADNFRNMGLQELLLTAAQRNGYSGRSVKGDTRGALQAAFSTTSLPGIFSNIANKFLLQGFMAVDQTWRSIASIRSVTDFKTVTSYRLNGGFEFSEVGNGGELQHGQVSEESYTNAAKTYGKMFAITREDIINDDLGALSALPQRIGRGAALKMNSVFWATFLNNSAHFTAGNNNLLTGQAFGTGVDKLTAAEQAFFDQTDPDGNPLALMPRILLVPTAIYAQASVVMTSAEVRNPSGKDVIGNPHAGKFQVLTTPYLSAASIANSSSVNWYLLADPADLATIECAFLNGNQQPIVEQAEADFSTLGVQMRGYFDFGVALQEPRAGVKNTA